MVSSVEPLNPDPPSPSPPMAGEVGGGGGSSEVGTSLAFLIAPVTSQGTATALLRTPGRASFLLGLLCSGGPSRSLQFSAHSRSKVFCLEVATHLIPVRNDQTSEEMAFVKSGWLLRQSTILKRWKKNWFDLWSDGHLIYYDDQTRQSMEDKVHMPVDCINIRTGHECRDIQPPDGKTRDCLLQIVCRDGKTISLCAESTDDCLAWKFTLQDSRTNTAYVGSAILSEETAVAASPPPYAAYATPTPEVYGYGPYSGAYPAGTQVVYAANGQAYAVPCQYPYAGVYGQQPANQVIIRERYRDSDSDLALGMLAGAATGMALGSLFWVF